MSSSPFTDDARLFDIAKLSMAIIHFRANEIITQFQNSPAFRRASPKIVLLSEVIALRLCQAFMDDLLKDELRKVLKPGKNIDEMMNEMNEMLDSFMKELVEEFYKKFGR
jgi:hypothetical protein